MIFSFQVPLSHFPCDLSVLPCIAFTGALSFPFYSGLSKGRDHIFLSVSSKHNWNSKYLSFMVESLKNIIDWQGRLELPSLNEKESHWIGDFSSLDYRKVGTGQEERAEEKNRWGKLGSLQKHQKAGSNLAGKAFQGETPRSEKESNLLWKEYWADLS